MLRDILPAHYRKPAYAAFALLGVILGSIPVYCAATDTGVPAVIVGALAVYAYVGGAFGLTAQQNVDESGV